MEGRKESKYNLAGICPKCGDTIKVELVIATSLIETNEGKGTEGKDNGKPKDTGKSGSKEAESGNIRPDNGKEPTGTKSSVPESEDTGKTKATKGTGGKTK